MSQIEKCELNIYEITEKTIYQAVENVNEDLDGEYSFKVYSIFTIVENYDLSIEINLGYVMHLMEITWSISEGFNEYISEIEESEGRELSEDEIDELWREIYDNTLGELNVEYIYPVEGKIIYDLSEIYPFYSGGLEIEINPLACDGDYCDVGAEINIKFKAIRIETVEKASDKFKEFLVNLLRIIHNVITL